MYYDDHPKAEYHKTLKITLPKSWKSGPTSRLLGQFVESYNTSKPHNTLDPAKFHLCLSRADNESSSSPSSSSLKSPNNPIPSDAIVLDVIPDRSDLYVREGPSPTLAKIAEEKELAERKEAEVRQLFNNFIGYFSFLVFFYLIQTCSYFILSSHFGNCLFFLLCICLILPLFTFVKRLRDTFVCVHKGCNNRIKRSDCPPYPPCSYHDGPPVFHETAKFWSCCPDKKAYEWEEFQAIPGCVKGFCAEKEETKDGVEGTKAGEFLGGCDLRERAMGGGEGPKLKKIEDFNSANDESASTKLSKLKSSLVESGIEIELIDQVIEGIISGRSSGDNEEENTLNELTNLLKDALKSRVTKMQRIE